MSFVLHIFFSGLIAFVPGQDDKELNVLLLDTGHELPLAGGTQLEHHHPLLLARAAKCVGACQTSGEMTAIAPYLFPTVSAERATDSLQLALQEGGAWRLGRSELSIQPSGPGAQASPTPLQLRRTLHPGTNGTLPLVPTTSEERADFHWVPDLGRIAPATGGLNPDLLELRRPNLLAARLKLTSGTVSTYRLVQVADNVEPIQFLPAQGTGPAAPYKQAVASWVMAEIQIEGSGVEISETSFCGETRKTMTLSPVEGGENLVEIAVLNLPQLDPAQRTSAGTSASLPAPGQHFEAYYQLGRVMPPAAELLLPRAIPRSLAESQPRANWRLVHPEQQLRSELLEKLFLGIDRGPYDLTICPMIQVRPGG
jgi:hypothetical protein